MIQGIFLFIVLVNIILFGIYRTRYLCVIGIHKGENDRWFGESASTTRYGPRKKCIHCNSLIRSTSW